MKFYHSPSLANCSFLSFAEEVAQLVEGGAPWFHIDIIDGHYVPNLGFPVRIVGELKKAYPDIVMDVHMMVDSPMAYFDQLAENGADYVSFHTDATNFSRRALERIHALGMKAGVCINPSQRVDHIEPFIHLLDYAVLMSVEPGYVGQSFMRDAVGRVGELAALRERHGNPFLISVDGGVDPQGAADCAALGAEVFVTGVAAVFAQEDGLVSASKRFEKTLADAVATGRG